MRCCLYNTLLDPYIYYNYLHRLQLYFVISIHWLGTLYEHFVFILRYSLYFYGFKAIIRLMLKRRLVGEYRDEYNILHTYSRYPFFFITDYDGFYFLANSYRIIYIMIINHRGESGCRFFPRTKDCTRYAHGRITNWLAAENLARSSRSCACVTVYSQS